VAKQCQYYLSNPSFSPPPSFSRILLSLPPKVTLSCAVSTPFHHFIVPHFNFILCFIQSNVTLCSPAKSQISLLQTEALQTLFTGICFGMLSVLPYRTTTNWTLRSASGYAKLCYEDS
jgi:hypothetical protein